VKEPIMSDKALVIISTGDAAKARTGLMWSLRCLQEGWLEEVKVVFFGPGENVLLADEQAQNVVRELQKVERPIACKFLADRDGTTEALEKLGVEVVYVGKIIADHIRDGWTPLVW
jgi:hypothetical protein